jgi:hypothetical protein
MEIETVRKYIGRKVLIILKNNFQYTAIIPEFENDEFTITDKFGKQIEISCDYIAFIEEKESRFK